MLSGSNYWRWNGGRDQENEVGLEDVYKRSLWEKKRVKLYKSVIMLQVKSNKLSAKHEKLWESFWGKMPVSAFDGVKWLRTGLVDKDAPFVSR